MSLPDNVGSEILSAQLAGPLPPFLRAAFCHVAEGALVHTPCAGENAAYRAVVALQRSWWKAAQEFGSLHRTPIGREKRRLRAVAG